MAARNDLLLTNGGGSQSRLDFGGGGGSGISLAGVAAPPPLVGSDVPTQRFDISVLSGLRPSDKYLGRNRVSEIREAYDTYLTGQSVGRGGQYAVDAARRYGTTITEAARGYLVTAGLPTLADIIPTPTPTPAPPPAPPLQDPRPLEDFFFPLPVGPIGDALSPSPASPTAKTPVELLIDALPRLFGVASDSSAPLQSQAYGYTPVSGDFGGSASSGGGLTMWLLLAGGVIAAYFIYKRYSG